MKRLLCLLTALSFAICVSAQGIPSLLIPTDVRSLGMGGTSCPERSGNMDVSLYYGLWTPGMAPCNIFGGDIRARVLPNLALTGAIKRFADTPYEVSSESGAYGELFKPYDLSISIGAEFFITPGLLAGIRLGNVTSALAKDVTGSSYCGDLYVRYDTPVWGVGLAGRNIGTPVNYGYGDYAIPTMAALSGNWSPLHSLTLSAEADYLFAGAFMAGVGAEYGIAGIAFLRAGYHYGSPEKALPSFLSLGAGGRYAGFKLDASVLLLSSTLGGSFMITLGYGF
ncbi:MAG: hypothetical protein J5737_03790 [Bacteroidales bacterium]|nr:hypothetical protein [Bacteroidales bacterium]